MKNHTHDVTTLPEELNQKNHAKGIGVETCAYIHPETDQFGVIVYRIYAPDVDGKSKLDHV